MRHLFFSLIALWASQSVYAQTNCHTILHCPDSPVALCDQGENDAYLWNAPAFIDLLHNRHDLAEGPGKLSLSLFSNCAASLSIRYDLFLDLNGDGVMETVVRSTDDNLPAGMVRYNNLNTPNYSGGVLTEFDSRPVAADQKYRFGMQISASGNNLSAALRWQSAAGYAVPQLPLGLHKIKWYVTDPNGNEQVCLYNISMRDCKAPEIHCLNGLSVNIMPTGMISLWAADFLQYVADNITPASQIRIGIRQAGTGTGFPVDQQGNPVINVIFNCNQLGPQEVELWAQDMAGNTAFCTTYVIVQDNFQNCSGSGGSIQLCARNYCSGQALENIHFQLDGSNPALPPFSLFDLSDNTGCVLFLGFPISSNITVSAHRNDNPLDGITNADMLLLSAHIQGTQLLTEPWQLIAADINQDGMIDINDVVYLQQLILGIQTNFPGGESWLFFPDTCDLNATPGVLSCPNYLSLNSFTGGPVPGFYGIKLGDLDCSANLIAPPSERGISTETAVLAGPIPNPTTGSTQFLLRKQENSPAQLSVYDLNGRLSWQSGCTSAETTLTIPAEAMPVAGVYFWRITAGNTVKTGRIIRE